MRPPKVDFDPGVLTDPGVRGVRGVFGALKSTRDDAGDGAIAWPGDRAGVCGLREIEPGVCGAPNGVTGPTDGGPPGVRGL